jgi:hypothetical protein
MVEVLNFLRTYDLVIYILVGVFAALQLWKFMQAWDELRAAAFGLEREKAQADLNVAALWLLVFLIIAAGEFYLVSFVVPGVPEANPLPTATINPLATPTSDLSLAATPTGLVTPVSTLEAIGSGSCMSETVMITYPLDGSQVQGVVTLAGTADIPNFGFYKYEIARPGDAVWLSINAGRQRVQAGELGDWDTRTLAPDEYLLRLVVVDNEGNIISPCVIRVRVLPSNEE